MFRALAKLELELVLGLGGLYWRAGILGEGCAAGAGAGFGAAAALFENCEGDMLEKSLEVYADENPPTLTSDFELSMIALFDRSASNLLRLLSVAALYLSRTAEFVVGL